MAEETKTELYRYPDFESWMKRLASSPPVKNLAKRKIGWGKEHIYQPIHVTQALADMMFKEWAPVHEEYHIMLNELLCIVKINGLPDYPGADYMTFTGSAAKAIQVDAESKEKGKEKEKFTPDQFPKGKKENALQYNLPAVRSDAIGCAFETLGNLFGRNVSREAPNNWGFDLAYVEADEEEK